MGKKKKLTNLEAPIELTISPELKGKVDEMVESTFKDVSEYWSKDITEEIYVPIDIGEITVLHVKPKKPKNKRLLIFVPGWGVTNDEFNDLYEALHDEIEFYYIETREKSTSRIKRRKTKLTVSEKAKDIQKVLDYLKITGKEFIISGPCWGATVILMGLYEKTLKVHNCLVFDPAYELTFPKFLIKMSILIPAFVISFFKSIAKFFVLLGMKEKRQRERTTSFIDRATIWKWKRSAFQNRNINLFNILPKIEEEIPVFNGSIDKFHPQIAYPMEAKAMPKGRFFFLEVNEDKRERILSSVLKEFALVDNNTKYPKRILEFEKKLTREV